MSVTDHYFYGWLIGVGWGWVFLDVLEIDTTSVWKGVRWSGWVDKIKIARCGQSFLGQTASNMGGQWHLWGRSAAKQLQGAVFVRGELWQLHDTSHNTYTNECASGMKRWCKTRCGVWGLYEIRRRRGRTALQGQPTPWQMNPVTVGCNTLQLRQLMWSVNVLHCCCLHMQTTLTCASMYAEQELLRKGAHNIHTGISCRTNLIEACLPHTKRVYKECDKHHYIGNTSQELSKYLPEFFILFLTFKATMKMGDPTVYHLLQVSHMSFSDWSLGGALPSTCNLEVQFQANVNRPDVSWPNEKKEMRKGHKCVWCVQGLMESAFASTLAAEWRHADENLHHASQEKGNGDGREIPKLVHFNCRVMNLFSLKPDFFSPTVYLLAFHNMMHSAYNGVHGRKRV